MTTYNGKVAIITGAGSGIGKALAEEMARRGAHVVISDINQERITTVGEIIEARDGKVTALPLNVTDHGAVKKMVDDAYDRHGRIDYIFNNAGIAIAGEVRDVSIDDWRAVLDTNLYGVIYGIDAAYPVMVRQGFGHIVNTSSIEGLVAFPCTVSYVASKFAVLGISNALRLEAEPLGVKVSAVCPGFIKTAIFEDFKAVGIDRQGFIDQLKLMPGITAEKCAHHILRGVEKNKATIVITPAAKLYYLLQRLSPGLIRLILRMTFARILRDARQNDT
jgi:NAD(P)-dependent dehydrogenase (short-subunit alcohol dehydrogenase family)